MCCPHLEIVFYPLLEIVYVVVELKIRKNRGEATRKKKVGGALIAQT
jgi:hypothetical protein